MQSQGRSLWCILNIALVTWSYTCDKMAENSTLTLYQCQFPDFTIVIQLMQEIVMAETVWRIHGTSLLSLQLPVSVNYFKKIFFLKYPLGCKTFKYRNSIILNMKYFEINVTKYIQDSSLKITNYWGEKWKNQINCWWVRRHNIVMTSILKLIKISKQLTCENLFYLINN